MPNPWHSPAYLERFRHDPPARQDLKHSLQAALDAAQTDRPQLRLPAARGLWRRRRGQHFDSTPEVFQQSGTTHFTLPEKCFDLCAGEVCLMPRGLPHGERPEQGPRAFRTLVMMFFPGAFSLHYAGATADHRVDSEPLRTFPGPAAARLLSHLEDITTAGSSGLLVDHAYVLGLWRAVLALVLMEIDRETEPAPRLPPLIRRCLNLIEVQLANHELGTASLSRQLRCSPDHLSRAFGRVIGTAPHGPHPGTPHHSGQVRAA